MQIQFSEVVIGQKFTDLDKGKQYMKTEDDTAELLQFDGKVNVFTPDQAVEVE
jgi:hypothetical protein